MWGLGKMSSLPNNVLAVLVQKITPVLTTAYLREHTHTHTHTVIKSTSVITGSNCRVPLSALLPMTVQALSDPQTDSRGGSVVLNTCADRSQTAFTWPSLWCKHDWRLIADTHRIVNSRYCHGLSAIVTQGSYLRAIHFVGHNVNVRLLYLLFPCLLGGGSVLTTCAGLAGSPFVLVYCSAQLQHPAVQQYRISPLSGTISSYSKILSNFVVSTWNLKLSQIFFLLVAGAFMSVGTFPQVEIFYSNSEKLW